MRTDHQALFYVSRFRRPGNKGPESIFIDPGLLVCLVHIGYDFILADDQHEVLADIGQ
jgi:hypothetical protein